MYMEFVYLPVLFDSLDISKTVATGSKSRNMEININQALCNTGSLINASVKGIPVELQNTGV